jgi:hypothetical protein
MEFDSTPLTALPQEIIERIAFNLLLAELCSLRLSCKALAEKSAYHLGATYCTKVRTNLSLTSIQTLDDRSRSPWARHVRMLHLGWDEEAGHGVVWDRDASSAILPTLPVLQTIRNIVLRFVNCRSIYLTALYESDLMEPARLDAIGYSDMLGISFLLIAATSLPLRKFQVAYAKDSRIRVITSRLHLEQVEKPAFKKAFSSLQELSLRIWVEDGPYNWIENLVSNTVRLQKLEWDVGVPEPSCFQATRFSRIQELSLHYPLMFGENLVECLIQSLHCLRSLRLSGVKLDQGWDRVFASLPYLTSLQDLSLHFLRIRPGPSWPLALSGLRDDIDVPGSLGQRLRLRRKRYGAHQSPQSHTRIVGMDYSGPGMENVIAMLLNFAE